VFGYDNVPVMIDGQRSHVERQINEIEAAVVRRIFQRSAEGAGERTIARELNDDRAVAPRPRKGRPSGWSPSTVHEVLRRPLYVGRVIWNQTGKTEKGGRKRTVKRPESEWIVSEQPSLRIVPDALWNAVQERRKATRQAHVRRGRGGGRPVDGIESKYLLTGILECATCGGGIAVLSRSYRSRRAYVYGCTSYHQRGASICRNH